MEQDKGAGGYTVQDFLGDNAALANECATEFSHRFGFPLRSVWSNMTGLDVLKLDDIIQSGEDSLEHAIEKKKGPDAVAIVHRLISGGVANAKRLKEARGQ